MTATDAPHSVYEHAWGVSRARMPMQPRYEGAERVMSNPAELTERHQLGIAYLNAAVGYLIRARSEMQRAGDELMKSDPDLAIELRGYRAVIECIKDRIK